MLNILTWVTIAAGILAAATGSRVLTIGFFAVAFWLDRSNKRRKRKNPNNRNP